MRAYIADFGLSTLSDSGSATTVAGSAIMGTPRWLAPELIPVESDSVATNFYLFFQRMAYKADLINSVPCQGVKRHHTNATDIYAFALVCYEASYTSLRL
jgi:serine/threonine protein kinase